MRPGSFLERASVWRLAIGRALTARAAWRRHGLGQPLAAALALLLIGGLLTTARSLLDLGEHRLGRHGPSWPTAVAGGLGKGELGPNLSLPWQGEPLPQGELEATLARLKDGAFGVAFEAVPVGRLAGAPPALDPASPEATGAFAPVVLIDRERPPLRIDIMGLGTTDGSGRAEGGGAAPVPSP